MCDPASFKTRRFANPVIHCTKLPGNGVTRMLSKAYRINRSHVFYCVGGEPEISMYVCSGIAVAEDQMYVTFWTYCIFVIHGEFGSSVSAFCDDERDYCRLGE